MIHIDIDMTPCDICGELSPAIEPCHQCWPNRAIGLVDRLLWAALGSRFEANVVSSYSRDRTIGKKLDLRIFGVRLLLADVHCIRIAITRGSFKTLFERIEYSDREVRNPLAKAIMKLLLRLEKIAKKRRALVEQCDAHMVPAGWMLP